MSPIKNTRKFKSSSTGEPCTIAQYLAELLVQRKAEKDNKGSLAYKFWNKSQKKQYQAQIVSVNRLIQEFGEDAVYDYIVNKNPRVFSSGFYHPLKWVKEEIQAHKKLLEKRQKRVRAETKLEVSPTDKKPPKPFGKKTLFSKLRNKNG